MALSLSFFECPSCGKRAGHVRQKPSHAFHLLASFATMGLWGIVWLFVAYDLSQKGYACLGCGAEAEKPVPKTHSLWEGSSSSCSRALGRIESPHGSMEVQTASGLV